MNKTNRKEKYNVSTENNQLVLILNSKVLLPEDSPVRVTSAQLEELDYRMLFLTLGFNLKKRWMKQQKRRLETHQPEKKVA